MLSAGSINVDENEEKRPRVDEEPPVWAQNLFAQITRIENNTNEIRNSFHELERKVEKIDDIVVKLTDKVTHIEHNHEDMKEKFSALEAKFNKLEIECAEQIDRSMRNSMTIHKLPKSKSNETWDETKKVLSEFLSAKLPGNWSDRIERAHRGRTDVIHARFMNWNHAQEVEMLFRQNKGKIDGVYQLGKFSPHTWERRRRANEARASYRSQHPGTKSYIKYPAILLAKKPDDDRYSVLKHF